MKFNKGEIIIKNFQECIEKIEDHKVIPHSTYNKLKDIEFEYEEFVNEICRNV